MSTFSRLSKYTLTMDFSLSTDDVQSKYGVSKSQLRLAEKKGLLKSSLREGIKVFNPVSIEHVFQISGVHTKPKYQIHVDPPNGFTCIDLFAGGGGTALGLSNAGFKHLLLSEFDKAACQTLRTNMPDWNVIEGDVAQIDFSPFRGKVDLVEGGFPCQAFSHAGKKRGFEDARGTLFYEFARSISETMPKIAVGENVRGLLTHDSGRTLKTMISILQSIKDENGLGYKVAFKLLHSQFLDVPQKRERLIIIAVRDDYFSGSILFPKELPYVRTLRESIGDRPVSSGQSYPEAKRKVMDLVPEGGDWRNLPEEYQRSYLGPSFFSGGGKTGMARRLAWDEPSLTLTCAPAQKQTERCHPDETRPLNVREYARLQTFPDSWKFPGSDASAYKQIGNAVPVNLAYYVGKAVEAMLQKSKDILSFDALEALENNTFDNQEG
jgi:DNA (cytosine-5)-methyltransferase 1